MLNTAYEPKLEAVEADTIALEKLHMLYWVAGLLCAEQSQSAEAQDGQAGSQKPSHALSVKIC
jgi:hypothetical protein